MKPKTIFDLPEPRVPVVARLLAAGEPDAPVERPVSASPPLSRSAVLYMEARPGIDGEAYFGACASCKNFLPEAAMRGAVRGDRCALFGADFPITDDSSCNMYVPNADGKPCGGCQAHAAEDVIKGARGSVSPWSAGFVRDEKKQCSGCAQFSYADSKCRLLAAINAAMPAVFEMSAEVKPAGRCTLWNQEPPSEDAR